MRNFNKYTYLKKWIKEKMYLDNNQLSRWVSIDNYNMKLGPSYTEKIKK